MASCPGRGRFLTWNSSLLPAPVPKSSAAILERQRLLERIAGSVDLWAIQEHGWLREDRSWALGWGKQMGGELFINLGWLGLNDMGRAGTAIWVSDGLKATYGRVLHHHIIQRHYVHAIEWSTAILVNFYGAQGHLALLDQIRLVREFIGRHTGKFFIFTGDFMAMVNKPRALRAGIDLSV